MIEVPQGVVLFSHRLADALRTSKRVLFATHANPDGDALSSLSACLRVFSGRGMKCDGLADNYARDYLIQLPFLDAVYVSSNDVDVRKYDLVVFVDSNSFGRANLAVSTSVASFAIDHHVQDRVASANVVWIDTTYPSATSMLFVVFQILGIPIDAQTASVLMCGLITDTELFQNHATSALAFRVAGELVERGADVGTMKQFGLNTTPFESMKSMGAVLQRIRVNSRYHAGAVILEENAVQKEVLTSIIKKTRMPDTVFVIRPKSILGRIEVSMRSSHKNVGVLARLLGGGGHPRAAAFRFSGKVVEQDGKITIM